MPDCLFCEIISGNVPSHKVYENDKILAFLDIGPVSRGHTLIIPKEHAPDLNAGSCESAMDLMRVVHHIAPSIIVALGAHGYNLGMNHGACAGQIVFHTHLHFMPRYEGIPRSFEKQYPSQQELVEVAAIIRKEIGVS